MKNKELTKIILLAFLSILIFREGLSQESYIKNRWNIKISYSRYKTGTYYPMDGKYETVPNIRVEGNYGIHDLLEVGLYSGLSRFEFNVVDITDSTVSSEHCFTPFYGANLNVHPLPLFLEKEDFRFDLYLAGRFGGHFFNAPEYEHIHGHQTEWGIGGGIAFYPWKHLGVFVEYSYGKYYRNDNSKVRYGLSLKF